MPYILFSAKLLLIALTLLLLHKKHFKLIFINSYTYDSLRIEHFNIQNTT